MSTPRFYVASLSAYNAGKLCGSWIEYDDFQDTDSLWEEIDKVLAKCGGEEWSIHDYENFPDLGENPDLDTIVELANCIEEYDPELVKNAYEYGSADADGLAEWIEDHYLGSFDSPEEWAEQYLDDTATLNVPETIKYYFDYEAFARDAAASDVLFLGRSDGSVDVFHH